MKQLRDDETRGEAPAIPELDQEPEDTAYRRDRLLASLTLISGIGLALCKQLANHLGAELELARSTATGCVFALKLPAAVGREKPAAATAPNSSCRSPPRW